jgi:hypothetical protein
VRKKTLKVTIGATALAVAAGVALTGCSSTTSGSAGPAPDDKSVSQDTPKQDKVETVDQKSTTLAWGQTYTYDDGLAVTNGTKDVFNTTMFTVDVQSAGVAGDAVYDSANGLMGNPYSKILPGASLTWTIAYGVNDPADLTVVLEPGFVGDDITHKYADVFFKGAAA